MKTLHQRFNPTRRLLAPAALTLAALLVAAPPARAAKTEIPVPTGSGSFGKSVTYLPNGNFVVTDPTYSLSTPTAVASVGAVYLYDGSTLALISTLTGSTANDKVGSDGVTVLSNGNFVVRSNSWNGSRGAVTWGSATAGVSGTVSAANSLVGSTAADGVGNVGVTALTNGNYVVGSQLWDNGSVLNAGAATWGNGTTGTVGAVSAANSLVGSTSGDYVCSGGVIKLSNGNYVVPSSSWDNGAVVDAGAVTWGNGAGGTVGAISATNSLVGSKTSDSVANYGVTALKNGNYVVKSQRWDNGLVTDAGAATWGNGTTGTVGAVSASNSLVGSTASDEVGGTSVTAPVTELSNGNYVVVSMSWNNGAVLDAGAVTWCSGTTGKTGAVSTSNSLVGSKDFDNVGSHGVTALSNGNYVVGSMRWDNSTVADAGAATWGSGTTGVTGAVSATNSLVGSKATDNVGQYIIALSNGSYVVRSPIWDNSTVVDAGAVTWCSGTTAKVGVISSTNSLVGSTTNDKVGDPSVTALSNGNYVVSSPAWTKGAVASAGAATWGNGTTGTVGVVSATNSLVGSTASDQVGYTVTALSNGNYVVSSTSWDNGAVANVGAATWGNGTTGVVGAVSTTNSLVGSTLSDYVGNPGVTALSNGNYVVRSTSWDNGAVTDAGAVTWGNGTTGVTGTISAANSLVGSTANDQVSKAGVTALSNGNYVVQSNFWSNSGLAGAGAVTWGNGTTGSVGAVSLANSLTGSTTNDSVGSGLTAFSNGNYVLNIASYNNGALTDAGAVAVGGATGPFGVISAANSVLGNAAYYGSQLVFAYDASADKLVVGQPSANQLTVLDKRPTVTAAPTDTTVDSGTSVTFTASGTGDPVPTLQWQVSVNGGVDWTNVSAATATSYTFTAGAGDTGKKYRAVFTNTAGSTSSTAATLTVVPKAVVISTWPSATAISYGQTLASSTLSGGSASVAGSFAFTSPNTAPTIGTANQDVTFTPTDSVNYNTATGTVSVTVETATPTVTTWPSATAITNGQTLASSTLSGGSASVAGSFAFTSPNTAPTTGTANQDVTFTPTDSVNYKTVSGTVSVTVTSSTSTYEVWAAAKGLDNSNPAHSSTQSADPDGDGHNNLYEFAFNGNPRSGQGDGKIVFKLATVASEQILTLTLPVRTGATFSGTPAKTSALIDGIHYKIEATLNFASFTELVSEVTGNDSATIQSGLPTLDEGWTYRSFRAAGTVPTVPKSFIRAVVSE